MEAENDMGQVGYVRDKLSDLEISKENSKVVGDGTFIQTSDTCYAELSDGIPTSTDDYAGNDREDPFIYSGNGMNLVLDDIDNENEVSNDCIPIESDKGLGLDALQTDCNKKVQEMPTKVSKAGEYSAPNIIVLSESVNKRHEINLEQNRYELSVKYPEEKSEDIIDVDFNLPSSNAENKKCIKLSPTECKQKVHRASDLTFTTLGLKSAQNLAMIRSSPECKDDKEIAKKLSSFDFEENGKKENFIYSEQTMNVILDDGAYGCEKFKDIVLSEYENRLGQSAIEMFSRNNEETDGKITLSKYERGKDVGTKLVSSLGTVKHEINEKKNQNKISIDVPEKNLAFEKEINFNLISLTSDDDHRNIMNLSPEFEKKTNIQSLEVNGIKNHSSFTPPERENVHDMAMIWTPTEYKDETEIAKELLSPETEENEKKEHFIYSGQGINFVLSENKHEYKLSKDFRCKNRFSLNTSTELKKEQEIVKQTKCETEKDAGEISLAYKSANNREIIIRLNQNESTNNIPEDKHEAHTQMDLNLNFSEPEKCMNLPIIGSSVEYKIRSGLSFTPSERENAHDLAIISTNSEGTAGNDSLANMFSSECGKELEIDNCSSIHPVCGTEQAIVNCDSSLECNKHIGITNFICNECMCERESVNDLSCSKAKASEKTYGNECGDRKINVANEKPKKLENKVIFLRNSVPGDSKHQQVEGKDLLPKPSLSLSHGKYLKGGNKIANNFREKYQKDTLISHSEFKFGRTNSTTSHTSNEENFQVPSESLAEKIVHQAEFYFSDFNILKNNFLLKHIRRNREGFLSLKLVSSFRKIKALTKDWRVVAYSLEGSKLLELNSEKNKVRRIEKVPKLRDTSYGKTVVAFNLPFKNPTAEDIKELFSKFGTIVHVEIVSLKSPSYNIYHKRCRYFNQEISSDEFGVVEFAKYEDALAAVKDEESHMPKENEMKVVPLMPLKYRSNASDARGSSTTSFANSRRGQGRFKPRSEMQESRQVDERDIRPPITEKYYRGNYRPRYAWKPKSCTDVRGKLLSERIVGEVDEVDKNHQVRRQLKASNTLNVNPPHQQQRGKGYGPGRFYPGSRVYGARADV